MKGVDYSSTAVPKDYRCHGCKAHGCKLWRETGFPPIRLECARCALQSQEKAGPVDANGFRQSSDGFRTDQIGWRLPAVPDEQGVGYWGYTSTPAAAIQWWRRLPTYLEEEAK